MSGHFPAQLKVEDDEFFSDGILILLFIHL